MQAQTFVSGLLIREKQPSGAAFNIIIDAGSRNKIK